MQNFPLTQLASGLPWRPRTQYLVQRTNWAGAPEDSGPRCPRRWRRSPRGRQTIDAASAPGCLASHSFPVSWLVPLFVQSTHYPDILIQIDGPAAYGPRNAITHTHTYTHKTMLKPKSWRQDQKMVAGMVRNENAKWLECLPPL